MVRGRSAPDVQVVAPAMKRWAAMRGHDVGKILSYAKALGTERKIRGYLEVLL